MDMGKISPRSSQQIRKLEHARSSESRERSENAQCFGPMCRWGTKARGHGGKDGFREERSEMDHEFNGNC